MADHSSDREEIAEAIDPETWRRWRGSLMRYPDWKNYTPEQRSYFADLIEGTADKRALSLEAADRVLALRDAPRDGGDGWLPIETAPKDGTLIGVGGGCAIWNDNGGFWHTAVGRDYGRRIQWKVTHWKNLDPATIPPSPNAGDGTQDTQGGGR